MSSSLRVNTIVPSTGTNVAIGTANGTVTFTDSVNFVLGTGSSIFSPASNTLTFGTNDAERLRITSAGSVGIGTDTPGTTKLKIETGSGTRAISLNAPTNGTYITFETAGTAYADIGAEKGVVGSGSADTPVINARGSRDISFRTNSSERLRITNNGTVHTAMTGTAPTWLGNTMACREKFSVFQGANFGEACFNIDVDNANSFLSHNMYYDGGWKIRKSGSPVRHLEIGTNGWTFMTGADGADDSASALTQRLRITSDGKVGINQASPGAMLQVDYDEGNSEVGLRLRAYNASGSKTWQLSEVNGNAGVFSIRNQTNSTEGLDIHGDGHVRVPSGDLRVGDNTDSNAGTKTISVGSVSSGSGGIGIFANPTNGNSFVQFGDGTSSADQYRGYMNYRHADDSLRFGTAGTDRLHIYANGKIHLGNSHIASNNLTRLHVGWNSGGTMAGESIIAGTLGNDTTAVSALLTMKNAGNRGAQGASGGSSLAKFEFNNGTAFEIDKYGRRTLPYQPGCKLTIDTNSQGGGNHAQTGRTILPFNSTGFGYNTGNHYNLTTHTFTAPLDGKYLVILSVNVIGDNIAYIYKNGSIHSAGEFRSNPNGTWEHMEISTVVECSANDTIQPYSQMTGGGRKFNGGNQPGSYWDTFTIYFLG